MSSWCLFFLSHINIQKSQISTRKLYFTFFTLINKHLRLFTIHLNTKSQTKHIQKKNHQHFKWKENFHKVCSFNIAYVLHFQNYYYLLILTKPKTKQINSKKKKHTKIMSFDYMRLKNTLILNSRFFFYEWTKKCENSRGWEGGRKRTKKKNLWM